MLDVQKNLIVQVSNHVCQIIYVESAIIIINVEEVKNVLLLELSTILVNV